MEMTSQRWDYTARYAREVFGRQDAHLEGLMAEAVQAGLPDIAVSADVGRMLKILTSLTPARRALEVGTLAGYSGIWIARALARGGRLVTIEKESRHAEFARRQFERAEVRDRVDQRIGPALDVLPAIAKEFGPGAFDVVFLDAVKSEYPAYWAIVRPLIAAGGLILADNVLGGGSWWIDDASHADRDAADRFSRAVAGDPDFEASVIPLREGVLVGRRVR